MYNKARNSLIFATGAEIKDTNDSYTVWELALNYTAANWTTKRDIPYRANHVGGTTVMYGGVERHYVLGGQNSTNEQYGNYNFMYEYDANTDIWTRKADMPKATGHISASTLAYKDCGLIILGGANNCWCRTSAIYYYSIEANNWTKIGDLPVALNTPVCSILNDWVYCQSGVAWGNFSWKAQLG
jgi:N-acetylneuraminic acid mutarotase